MSGNLQFVVWPGLDSDSVQQQTLKSRPLNLRDFRLRSPRSQLLAFADDVIQPFLRVTVPRKAFLFGPKRGRVVVAPAVDDASGMFDVQHLVKDDVLDEPFGNFPGVQGLANRDGVVRGVVVAENAFCWSPRPGQYRLFDLSVKITAVELRENPFEIINLTNC